jgi:hypothetical protein
VTTYNGPRQLREQKDFDRLTAELVRAQPPTKRSVIRWREDVPVPLDSIVIVFTPVAGGSLVLPRPESKDDGRTVIVAVAEGSGPLTVECPRPEEAAERKELVQPGAYTFYAIDRVYYVDTAIVGSVPAEAVAAALEADGTSVLGKFDAGTGDVAPIVATSDFTVLTREAGELTFDNVRPGHLNVAADVASVGFDFVWAGVNGGTDFYRLAADFGDGDVYVSGGVLRIASGVVQPSKVSWTSSTTWVVPDNVIGGWLVGCGGGGEGGGGARPDNGSNTIAGGGGGGGGGAEERIQWVDLTPGETCTITIGAGGSSAGQGANSDASSGTDGALGGNTTFVCAAGTFTFRGARGGVGGLWNAATTLAAWGGASNSSVGAPAPSSTYHGIKDIWLRPGTGGFGGETGTTTQAGGTDGVRSTTSFLGGSSGSTGADNTGCGGSGGGGGGGGAAGVGANGGNGGAGAAGGTASAGTNGSAASANTGAGGGGGGAGGNSSGTSGNGGNGGNGGSGYLYIVHG